MAEFGTASTAAALRSGFTQTWAALDDLTAALDREAWATPTGCPGWTVHDCIAHVAALERLMLGEPQPDHELPDRLAHMTEPMHRFIEVGVDLRRDWTAGALLADFRDATALRLRALASLTDADLDEVRPFLTGTMRARTGLGIRLFDCWSHEQDIRRALGRPGGLDGVAGAHGRERLVRGIASRIQDEVNPPVGTTVLFDVVGSGGARRTVTFDGTPSRATDLVPEQPTVTLRLDLSTLTVLGCGRHDDPAASNRVEVSGDVALGRRMLENVAFTP